MEIVSANDFNLELLNRDEIEALSYIKEGGQNLRLEQEFVDPEFARNEILDNLREALSQI